MSPMTADTAKKKTTATSSTTDSVAVEEAKTNTPDTGDKAALTSPGPLENKSMDGKDDKATEVKVVIAHPIRAGLVGNEKELKPGEEFSTSKTRAKTIVTQGAGRYAGSSDDA